MAPNYEPESGRVSADVDATAVEGLIDVDDLERALQVLANSRQFEEGALILQTRLKQAKRAHVNDLLSLQEYNETRSRLGYDTRQLLRGELAAPLTPDPPDWLQLRDLAQKMEKNWIEAFYERYLPDERPISIPLRTDYDAVDHTWPGSSTQPEINGLSNIIDVYEQMNGYVLILGNAGSGKTFAMFQIAAHLLHKLKVDHALPVPVILDLADWNRNSPVLVDWVVERLNRTYVVDRESARAWLKNDRLVLLLDNLGRVSEADRDACIQAINQFLNDFTPNGLVVCTREAEYLQMSARLQLWMAVHLQALNRQEVTSYLTGGSPKLAELNGIVLADPGLLDLCASPLGISLLWDTYQTGGLSESTLATGSLPTRRAQLFERYIERVLPEAAEVASEFSRAQSLRWLGWLAQHISGTFWYECMQPAWLPNRTWQQAYYFISRMLFGLSAGLLGGIIIGLGLGPEAQNLWRGIIEGLTAGLVVGIVAWLADSLWQQRFQRVSQKWLRSILNVVILVLGSVAGVVALFLIVLRNLDVLKIIVPEFQSWDSGMWLEEARAVGALTGLSAGLVFGIEPSEGHRNLDKDILTGSVERLRVSGLRAWRFSPYGLVFGAIAGLVVAIKDLPDETEVGWVFINPLMEWAWNLGWTGGQAVVAVMVLTGVICGLVTASVGALTGSAIVPQSRNRPDQAIRLSLRNAVIIGGTMGTAWFFIGGVLGGYTFALYGLFIGYLAFLWFGGLNVFLHFVLRILLRRLDFTPPVGSYTLFLDHCTQLRFMSAVVGGYIFRHSLWQEHFAARFRSSTVTKQQD
jgi:hypothetical protein